MKLCKGCGETKPLVEFYSNGPGRYRPLCKPCARADRSIRYWLITDGERAEILRRFDDGESIERIRIALGRSQRAVSYILAGAGRDTTRGTKLAQRDRAIDLPIGALPDGHPLAEVDAAIELARTRRQGANPWPVASSLV